MDLDTNSGSVGPGGSAPGLDSTEVRPISTGYTPRAHQEELHSKLRRFNVLVCHRRFGKTVFCINEMLDQALNNTRKNPQYAYFAPFYGQAKRVAWDYMKDFTRNIPGWTANEADLRIEIYRKHSQDKIKIMLLGADNPGAIRGIYLDGAILDEYAEMNPEVWTQVIRPALSDRLGWAIFIGTPKGQNHFESVYTNAQKLDNWFTMIYKASETNIIAKEELDAARAEMSEEEYNQEFECSFSSPQSGSYYGKYIEDAIKEGRVRNLPYDPALAVTTYWDLGIGDTTTIWFMQRLGREFRFIDYFEMSGVGLAYYAKKVLEKPYVYDRHCLPHDAAAKSLDTGNTRQEALVRLGIRGIIIPRQAIDDGIQAVRAILPLSYFDKAKCDRGISALKSYARKWDSKNQIFSDTPKHDWASNGADAMRYCAMGERLDKKMNSTLPRKAENDYDVFGGDTQWGR